MSALNLGSLAGWIALAFVAWLAGGLRRPVPWRTVIGSTGLILIVGLLVFTVPTSRAALVWVNGLVLAVLDASRAGAEFLFGPLALSPGQTLPDGTASIGFVFATQVLSAVIFFAALMALLYHLRLIQPLVRLFARVFHRLIRLSGAEALGGASNIFVGVESAVTVRPYIGRMTRSELLTLLTCGMSTVASTTMAIYVLFLEGTFPLIAGHVISASVLSIPTAALVSKLMLPETETPQTRAGVPIDTGRERESNALSALATGAMDGLKLAAGIATLLIAILGLVALIDLVLGRLTGGLSAGPLDLGVLLGWLFTPLAWLLGIEGADLREAATLLGVRTVMTEVVAYQQLAGAVAEGAISPRTMVVLSYALSGFSHIASVGIFVGGFAALAPERRADLTALGPRALIGSTLATLMTGALAGALYFGQRGVLG